MQMAIIIVGGYVVATSPPVNRLIRRLATIPKTPRAAIAFVAFFAMAASLVSWGFSLIFSGLLAREVVKQVRAVDYRAIGTAAYLGSATVWALGLSSSAALLMATPSSIPAALVKISGVIPLSQTIYTWQSITVAAILMSASVAVAYLSAPASSARTAESFGVMDEVSPPKLDARRAPAEWLEFAPLLSLLIGVLGLAYFGQVVVARAASLAAEIVYSSRA
jgi:short-chain fatty acids transporter